MTAGSIDPVLHIRRWGELVSLLSMDVVRPFYDLMGLRPSQPDGLQRLLRQDIVNRRRVSVTAPDAVRRVVQAVGESLGAEARRQLIWWEEHVFHGDPSDNLDLDRWDTILRYCRHEPDLWKRLFPDSTREKALDRFRQSLNIDEYQRRLEEMDTQPLSDWDLQLYALNLWDDNLDNAGSTAHVPDGPRVWVKPTVRDYQGYRFWTWVLRTHHPEQLDRLWQESQRIVEKEELRSARDLPHPSILDIEL